MCNIYFKVKERGLTLRGVKQTAKFFAGPLVTVTGGKKPTEILCLNWPQLFIFQIQPTAINSCKAAWRTSN